MVAHVIRANGVDITTHVMRPDCRFTMSVNGRPGEFFIKVLDENWDLWFWAGEKVTLDIDGDRYYDGFIVYARQTFPFDVDDMPNGRATRIWELEGSDVNLLFQKRYVYNVASPTQGIPDFAVGTHDDVIVKAYVDSYLNLGGDGITTNGVTYVGTPAPDTKLMTNSGSLWLEAMSMVANPVGAVWYIGPDRDLVYEDANTETAPFKLSDVPTVYDSTISDAFGRTVSAGETWGTGDLGTWSGGYGHTAVSVSGGKGLFTVTPTYYYEWQYVTPPASVFANDEVEFICKVTWPATFQNTANSSQPSVALDIFDDPDWKYQLNLWVGRSAPQSSTFAIELGAWTWDPNQEHTDVFNLPVAPLPNDTGVLRFSYTRSSRLLRGKYYKFGTAEPDWQVSATLHADFAPFPEPYSFSCAVANYSVGGTFVFDDITIGSVYGDADSIGYSNFSYTEDGTTIINDELAWGVGTGRDNAVFARVQDTTSIGSYLRWQHTDLKHDMYKQPTIDTFANRMVYGSPQNLHGRKDPSIQVNCRVIQPGLLPGMKARFINNAFGIDEVFPIRRMTITFPTTTEAFFDLFLSREQDLPWSWAEFPPYDLAEPKTPTPLLPPPKLPKTGQGCDESVCGITDAFGRVVSANQSSAGTSDSGHVWTVDLTYDETDVVSVDDVMTVSVTNRLEQTLQSLPLSDIWSVEWLMRFNSGDVMTRVVFTLPSVRFSVFRDIESPSTDNITFETNGGAGFGGTTVYDYWPLAEDTWYRFRLSTNKGTSGTDPLSAWWQIGPAGETLPPNYGGAAVNTTGSKELNIEVRVFDVITSSVSIDDLDIAGVTRCDAVQFEDWNRPSVYPATTPSGYGTGIYNPGTDATILPGNAGGPTGFYLVQTHRPGLGGTTMVWVNDPGPWTGDFTMTKSILFDRSDTASSVFWRLSTDDGSQTIALYCNYGPSSVAVYRYGETAVSTAFTFDIDVWYHTKTIRSGGSWQFFVWRDGNPEPTTPTISAEYTFLEPSVWFYMAGLSGGPPTGTVTVWHSGIDFFYDGRPCYDCAALPIFDDFNRTLASGWGNATSGYAWSASVLNGTSSVTGTAGRLTVTGANGYSHQTILDLPYQLPVEYTLYITPANWPPYSGIGRANITIRVGYYSSAQVSLFQDLGRIEIGNFGSPAAYSNGHSFASAFMLKIRLEASQIQAKTWLANSAEPAEWDVTGTGNSESKPIIACYVNGNENVTGFRADFDYISIADESDTCALVPVIIDDFSNRTITGASVNSSANSLGVTSGEGIPWVNTTTYDDPYTVNVSSIATLTATNDLQTVSFALVNGQSQYSYQLTGSRTVDWLFTNTELWLSVDIKSSQMDSSLTFSVTDGQNPGSLGRVVEAVAGWDSADTYKLYLDTNAAVTTSYRNVFSKLSTWYRLQIRVIGSRAMARAWEVGTPEPNWMITLDASPLPWQPGEVLLMMSTDNGQTFEIDNLVAYLPTTGSTPAQTPAGAYGCEEASRVTSTTYSLNHEAQAGSTEVSVDGAFQRYGIDYSESPSNARLILFDEAVAADSVVWVCYRTKGTS